MNALKVHSRALPCCMLGRNANQSLALCVRVVHALIELISSGEQPCIRGLRVCALLSEICALQAMERV